MKEFYEAMRTPVGPFSATAQPTFFVQRWDRYCDEAKLTTREYALSDIRAAFAAGWNAALDQLGCNESREDQ